MNENIFNLPFDERVRLARKELERTRPLLERTGQEDKLNDIVAKWRLDTGKGLDALLEPYDDRIRDLEAQLRESSVCGRINKMIDKWKGK